MSNCNEQFKKFNSILRLTKDRKESLLTSRNSLKDKISKYFKENKPDEIQPKFFEQGSFAMNTIINPIPVDDKLKYDIDLGIYFIGDEERNDRYSISTYHNWIFNSVENHTETTPIRKSTCIRVIFSDGHHIDLPIYYKSNDVPDLAHKSKGWIESDPVEFIDWFNDLAKENQQLRRLVRYMKSWLDYRNTCNSSIKMPSGFILTILTANNYSANDRDDIAFYDTLSNIFDSLSLNFICYRPTTPSDEDLLKDFSDTRKDYFLECLDNFTNSAKEAIKQDSTDESCKIWKKQFGDRFPSDKSENKSIEKNSTPVTIITNPRKPWRNYELG